MDWFENEKLNLAKSRGIYSNHELFVLIPSFLANRNHDKINRECQNRHIIGTYEYMQADIKSKKQGFAGSAFFNSDFDIYKEIARIRGTGILIFDNEGRIKSETIKYHRIVGFGGMKKLEQTDVVSIRYSKTGSHAFPVHKNKFEDDLKFVKSKNLDEHSRSGITAGVSFIKVFL
jgi:hypothetical protein